MKAGDLENLQAVNEKGAIEAQETCGGTSRLRRSKNLLADTTASVAVTAAAIGVGRAGVVLLAKSAATATAAAAAAA
eukprot:CAMPEP_0197462692 /NCGR_PEP_ID=MMETSP1175-20131217/59805_1 /TAXON_ID=1003142 /ORGANISM="Triceratium dubium, Strain CCMP147" /LENGTH=76 /DNA_ID=CAMNT_0042998267 /DNA_START=44 /DNA_END=270 /DNA_ORIENTATION=-